MNLDFLKDKSISDILILGFFIGLIYNMIMDVIYSLCDYLNSKSYKIYDYEKIIIKLYDKFYDYDNLSNKDISYIHDILYKYDKRKNKKSLLNKMFNKKKS